MILFWFCVENPFSIMECNCFVNILWKIHPMDSSLDILNSVIRLNDHLSKTLSTWLNQSAISSFVVSSWYLRFNFKHCSISKQKTYLYSLLSNRIVDFDFERKKTNSRWTFSWINANFRAFACSRANTVRVSASYGRWWYSIHKRR